MAETQAKKSVFETPLLSTKIKSSSVKLFPETAVGYLLGPMLAMIANGVVNAFLVQYWDKVLDLGTWAPVFETILPIVSAIIIIIGNLFVGKLMNKKPSIAGKARPLILLGLPIIAVALLVLFMVPFPEGATLENPSALAMIMVAIGYNLYYAIAWPFYYTAHSALVNVSTRDGSKRSLLATASNAAQLGAAGLAGMVGPFIIDLLNLLPQLGYDANGTLITNEYGKMLEGYDSSQVVTWTNAESVIRAEANGKWFIIMIIMIVALVLGCLMEYYFTRERITEEQVKLAKANPEAVVKDTKKASMSEQIKICLHDKYWWFIIIFYFLYQFGGMFKNNSGTWFSQAFTGGTSISGLINAVGAIPTAAGMAVIWPLANKFGKANSIKVGGFAAFLLGCIGFTVLIPGLNTAAISGISVAAFCLKALGTVPAMYISMALMSNVLEHQEALYGKRTDGFTMAVYGSIMVSMAGVANGIIVGLKSAFPAEMQKGLMTALFFGVESVCYLIIGLMFLGMNVEKFSKFDQKAIVADQKAQVLAEGGEWIEPEERARLEEEENARLVEEARVNQLKIDCEKKGLNFEDENNKYLAAKAEADKAAAAKKADAEAKKAAKEAEKKAAYDALPADQKAAIEAKKAAKAEKLAAAEAETEKEFEALRAATAAARAI
jgi:GPH family glycoside/pentoside/hexuronide:cation symporter